MLRTILVIEDSNEIRENIAEILQLKDYEVITATNGITGIQLALNVKPDLVLSDILIPELDGFEVIKHLKQLDGTRDIPFVFIASQSDRQNITRAYELGASGYIIKPFDGDELISQIEQLLATIALDDQNLDASRS